MIKLIMINKSPIYQQLNNALRKLISEDKYSEGDRFLTERSVCNLYEVSRTTANKALSSLVAEGILEFKKGVGTFIKSKPVSAEGIAVLTDFLMNAKQAGMTPASKVLNFETLTASDVDINIAESLQMTTDEQIFSIELLNLANGKPLAVEYRYIVARLYPELSEKDLTTSLTIRFMDKYEIPITETEERLHVVNLQKKEAEIMAAESGAAAFSVTTIGFTNQKTPLWFTKTVYKPDSFEFLLKVDNTDEQTRSASSIILSEK